MTADDEGFLARWSRRKRADAAEPEEGERAIVPVAEAPSEAASPADADPKAAVELPPVETLGADDDYTAFLRPGVPLEVSLRGLRRAWVADPRIADFRGMADYDWDFHAPGYGALKATDDLADLARRVFDGAKAERGPAPDDAPPAAEPVPFPPDDGAADRPEADAAPVVTAAIEDVPEPPVPPAAEAGPAPAEPLAPRRHGGALPR